MDGMSSERHPVVFIAKTLPLLQDNKVNSIKLTIHSFDTPAA